MLACTCILHWCTACSATASRLAPEMVHNSLQKLLVALTLSLLGCSTSGSAQRAYRAAAQQVAEVWTFRVERALVVKCFALPWGLHCCQTPC